MKKLTLFLLVLAFAFTSCDVTDLNENEKDPTEVPPDPLFTNAQFTMGNYLQDVSVNTNIFNMMAQHWSAATYTAEARYEIDRRTIPSTIYSIIYRNVLNDLKAAEESIQSNETVSPGIRQNKLASIEVMQALAFSKLVDIFGGVPYTEAVNPENITPAYTDGKTIYTSLIDSLDAAIGAFNPSASSFGTNDIYYNGDVNKWIKFANSLKLRLGIMFADSDPSIAQTVVAEAAPNAFTSRDDNAMIPFQSSPPYTNPIWEAEVQSQRDDFVMADPLVSRMNNLNDPRREELFTQVDGEYIGAPYAVAVTVADYSRFTDIVLKKDRPGMILSYSEVEFIRSEAAARGYNVTGTAAEHYTKAITADMESWGVPAAEIATYMAQPEVAYATAEGDFRQKIGVQKWISLYLQGLQAWTSYRRLDAPDLTVPDVVVVTDIVPRRFTYPIEEERFNSEELDKAIQAMGGNKLTTRIFWDTQ